MKIKILILAAILAVSTIPAVAQDLSDKLLAYSNNVVQVFGNSGSGSGTFVSPRHILTNNHVVSPQTQQGAGVPSRMLVLTPDGKTRVALVLNTDVTNDLALLRIVNYKHNSYASFVSEQPTLLDKVWSMGYPGGVPLTITEGRYQYRFTNRYNHICEFNTAPIFFGNSGGSTVVVEDGQIKMLGVPTSIIAAGRSFYPHGSCSVSYTEIQKFIRRANPNLAMRIFDAPEQPETAEIFNEPPHT